MKGFQLSIAAISIGFIHQSTEAFAARRVPMVVASPAMDLPRMSARLDSADLASTPLIYPPTPFPPFPVKLGPCDSSRRRFAGAIATTSHGLSVQKSIQSLRGGSTGFAVRRLATNILDDVGSSKTKSWAVLVASVLVETVASTLSKKARDTSNPRLFAFSLSLNLISLCGFCTALKKLDVGLAYAMWAALGTVIVTAAGVMFFKEAIDPRKVISILLVILGVAGLNLGDEH